MEYNSFDLGTPSVPGYKTTVANTASTMPQSKSSEATKIINFIYRANRTYYNNLEARESDICSFIEREIERIIAQKDAEVAKAREEAWVDGFKATGEGYNGEFYTRKDILKIYYLNKDNK